MKNKVYGFFSIVALVTTIIGLILAGAAVFSLPIYIIVLPVLCSSFIFAKNNVVKNVGFALCGITAALGFALITGFMDYFFEEVDVMLLGVGFAIYSIIALIKLISSVLSFFGYRRAKREQTEVITILKEAKQLEADGLLTEEEFSEIKSRTLKNDTETVSSIEELKTWKKLFDQQIINEKEFSELKSKIIK